VKKYLRVDKQKLEMDDSQTMSTITASTTVEMDDSIKQ
jgi:septum formation topological specificity factor MinE